MLFQNLTNRFQILSDVISGNGVKMTGFKCEINYEHKGYLIVDKISGSPKTGYQNSIILYRGENFQEEVCKFDSVEEAKSYIDFLIPDQKNKKEFTAHDILTRSSKSKILATHGVLLRGVLNSEEQKLYMSSTFGVQVIANQEVFWFTDDCTLGGGLLPKDFVPSSTQVPHNVVLREDLPSGVVKSIEDLINVYYKGKRQINNIDELVEYLNTNYA
jgi:hypothetical protein